MNQFNKLVLNATILLQNSQETILTVTDDEFDIKTPLHEVIVRNNEGTAYLEGIFTIDQLEAILAIMKCK